MGIGIKMSTFTSIGTGTTKTKLQTVNMPSWVRSILAVIPIMADITTTAAQSILAQVDLESSDCSVNPYQCLASPIGSGLGATYNTLTGKEKYLVGVTLKGSENIDVFGTALVANTVAPKMGVAVVISDKYSPFKPRHAKVGTATAMGTAVDTDVPGTAYQISGANRIVELMGMCGSKVIAAGDAILGMIKFTSNELDLNTPLDLPLFPNSFGLGATGSMLLNGVSRADVDVPVKSGQVTIRDFLNCIYLPAAAGTFIDGVIYE
jgi:hypothetical protein